MSKPMNAIGSDSSFRDEWLEGAARAFFVTAYADFVGGRDLTFARPRAGEDWKDYAPEPPANAYALAGELWAKLHASNGAMGVYSLVLRAEEADGEAPDAREFGWCLAMQAMGHGVSWFDDHADFEIKVPHVECSRFSFSDEAYGC